MTISIAPAKRKRVPMLISIAGVSGSGKTYSALLLAAGLAGNKGTVGFLDTENGRGSMYADSPGIMSALPNGYDIAEMQQPFSPVNYLQAVEAFEASGCAVLVIDSMSHEWEGYGGCADIAENNKLKGMPNWIKAKTEHKRMMNRLLASNMHIIFCLRAREKIAVARDSNGKEQFIQKGLQPIQEKNFTFEMTLSMLLDESTHRPIVTKCPEPLIPLFGADALVSRDMGERLRQWSDAAPAPRSTLNEEQLFQQGLDYAGQGMTAYQDYWTTLTKEQKALLLSRHDELKTVAQMADARRLEPEQAL